MKIIKILWLFIFVTSVAGCTTADIKSYKKSWDRRNWTQSDYDVVNAPANKAYWIRSAKYALFDERPEIDINPNFKGNMLRGTVNGEPWKVHVWMESWTRERSSLVLKTGQALSFNCGRFGEDEYEMHCHISVYAGKNWTIESPRFHRHTSVELSDNLDHAVTSAAYEAQKEIAKKNKQREAKRLGVRYYKVSHFPYLYKENKIPDPIKVKSTEVNLLRELLK